MKRITVVIICGACAGIFEYQGQWTKDLQEKFNKVDSNLDYRVQYVCRFYLPWQMSKIREIEKHIVDTYDNGSDLVLYGHSIGGLIARDVAGKLQKSKVHVIVTHGTPINIDFIWGQKNTSKATQINFVDILDPVVWFPWSVSWKNKMILLRPTGHFIIQRLRQIRVNQIAEYVTGK